MSPPRRSVATVLFTDIVGSTETAQRLGDRGWRDVLSRHHAVVRSELRRYQGEEIGTAGDGFLAVFESPALALLCAAAIRDAVRELALEIRTGVHHGEIQRDAGTVGGIGVHIGARVAALAGASEILISGTVRDAVQGAGFEFEDRGERQLKGIAGSWHLYALSHVPAGLEWELLGARTHTSRLRTLLVLGIILVLFASLATLFLRPAPDGVDITSSNLQATTEALPSYPVLDKSIAVLPFDTRSSSDEDEYFARGMHDDILTTLSRIDSLKVISRTSVERYAGTTISAREIGRELGVATLLEGSIQRSGNRVHLTFQLIDARNDRHLWAQSFDEELSAENLFAIQSDLAQRIAGSLRAQLRSSSERQAGAQPTESLEAYLHWARGKSIGEQDVTKRGLEEAAQEFREAIRADSTYALPWAMLAELAWGNWIMGYRSAEEAFPEARSAIDRALSLDPNLAAAHDISGRLYMSQWRFKEAELAYLKEIQLAPGLSSAHQGYSDLLLYLGRLEEAETQALRALELDPLNASLITDLGWIRWAQGDWDSAVREASRALEIDPNLGEAYNLLGNAHGMKGDHLSALSAIESGRQRVPNWPYWTVAMANALAKAGNRSEALRWIDMLPSDPVGLERLWVASVYGNLGDSDQAFSMLEISFQRDPYMLVLLEWDRDFDSIRRDPRFEDVRRRARAEVMRRNETY